MQGTAVGDLNNDGFVDIVTVASAKAPAGAPVEPIPVAYGSVFDAEASFIPVFGSADGAHFDWLGIEFDEGDLSVEINQGNDNASASFVLLGGAGRVGGAEVNRSGIGAVLTFTPSGEPPTMKAVAAGSSYASQDSLVGHHFGVGSSEGGTLDVLWPSGVRSRLDDVTAGERLTVPEIPCDIASSMAPLDYRACVPRALEGWSAEGEIDGAHRVRLFRSAMRAYWAER